MGMWVRSQAKTRLVLCDHFAVTFNGNVLGFQGPDDADGIILGSYETEKRALEVLNLIQHLCRVGNTTLNMPKE